MKLLAFVNYYNHSLTGACLHGFRPTKDLALETAAPSCACVTPVFDGGDPQATYHRLAVEGDFEGAKLEVIVAVSNVSRAVIGGQELELADFLGDPDIRPARKAEVLCSLAHVRKVNTEDLLLHDLTGRFIWVYVAVHSLECTGCRLTGMRLELPRQSFAAYLPEIYQGNAFLDRYLAVFQSLYLELERRVDGIPARLDYETASDRDVAYLAEWLGIREERDLFTPAQLRHMIAHIDLYQGGKGTVEALVRIVEMATGVRPRVVEQFRWNKPGLAEDTRTIMKRLYGDRGNHFCVILDLTHQPLAEPDRPALERLIEQYSVMGSQFHVVYLGPCNHTDVHCYLDVNGALSVPEIASVEGAGLGAHITTG